jgi:hypothetical protein
VPARAERTRLRNGIHLGWRIRASGTVYRHVEVVIMDERIEREVLGAFRSKSRKEEVARSRGYF